ncbi:unnamed protein product [Urochloa humidicola]
MLAVASMASWPCAPAPAVMDATLRVPPLPSAAVPRRAPAPPAVILRAGARRHALRGAAALVAGAAMDDVRPAIDEWPENFSLLSYADQYAYLESQITTAGEMGPGAKLVDVMSHPVQVATPGQRLAEVDALFAAHQFSGLPVVDDQSRCVGVVSNKDMAKAPNGMESTVDEVMSSPAITLTLDKTVLEAAALMLKEKVHRIPVVNEQQIVIGIITRTDVFQALEANNRA